MPIALALKGIVGGLVEKALENKIQTVVGSATVAAGTAAIVDPKLLEMIPESVRGWAVLAVVVTLCAKSIINAIGEAYRDAHSKSE